MAESITHDLELAGCTPEPLMAYLKALGILRLVSEQKDPNARGWWRKDVFHLRSMLDRDALVKFFVEEYQPTPIVVPWSGGDFFGVNWSPDRPTHAKTPTSSKVVEAILATNTDRFAPYRRALQACKAALSKCAIDRKEKMDERKWAFIQELRSSCDEPRLIEWIDAAAVATVEKFAALLGSGGGSDGNTHFSDNFMQNLWDVLPDFDAQRDTGVWRDDMACRAGLRASLFREPSTFRIEKRTSSLFDSGAVGGPNATQGMERESLSNPWDMILALEGTISFAGAATKRLGLNAHKGAFPFQVSASVTSGDGLAEKERAGTELWLPLWTRPARSEEVLALLREGRAQCGPRSARNGVDMARAIASLGVDRGIAAFGRYAILKGRVGGENYNTAASLGRFYVAERPHVDLLREVDPWLDRFRRAAGDKDPPPRFASAVRRIDSAIFEFCKYGGAAFFQNIVVALGLAERELANAERFREEEEKELRPVAGLSSAWIEAAADGSPEFTVARSLACVYDPEQKKIGPLRANLEAVDWNNHCRAWAEKERCVVWNAADLATNLANVLQRRMMDGERARCEHLPLDSPFPVELDTIAAFLAGDLDDERIEELIWGLMLIKSGGGAKDGRADQSRDREGAVRAPEQGDLPQALPQAPLPRHYALLKLLYLPRPLVPERQIDKKGRPVVVWRLAKFRRDVANPQRKRLESGIIIRPEPRVLPLLRAGRIGEACRIAAQRLRVSGLSPMPGPLPTGVMRDNEWDDQSRDREAAVDPSPKESLAHARGSDLGRYRRAQHLAAALLIPISSKSVNRLVHLVCRADDSAAAEAIAVSAEGETE